MIKYFCDRCGNEIKGKVHEETSITEASSYVTGEVVATWKSVVHICDDCEQKDLTCGFRVGDRVITADGRTGTITDICICDRCKERGFYEPTVTFDNHREYISISDKNDGFKSYYSIGDRVFGNLDEKSVCKELDEITERQRQLILQFATIQNLKGYKENDNGN